MNIIALTFVVLCLFDQAVSVHTRENSNVLVPNNDVNFQAKIKNLLSDEEVDREDFSDNEIESLNSIKNLKIEKIFSKNLEKGGKILDENYQRSEENRIGQSETKDDQGRLGQLKNLDNRSVTPPQSYETSTHDLNHESSSETLMLTTSIINGSTSESWITTSFWTTPNSSFIPKTPEKTTLNSTRSQSTINTTNSPSPSSSPGLTTTSVVFSTNATRSIPDLPSTVTIFTPTSTTYQPIYDDLQPDECILGNAERHLLWVDVDGNLSLSYINENYGFVRVSDLSRVFKSMSDYDNWLLSSLDEFHVSSIKV